MANKYYYFVASLSYLVFGESAETSSEEFLYECEKWFSDEEMKTITSMDIANPLKAEGHNEFAENWGSFNLGMEQELAFLRGDMRYKRPKRIYIPEDFDKKDPLEKELLIEKLRWKYLESEESKYCFDFNNLMSYFLKIQINERIETFSREKGEERFKKVCEESE